MGTGRRGHILQFPSGLTEVIYLENICWNYNFGEVGVPPFMERIELREELLFMEYGSINTTTTVISSWKCLLTPRSIFLRSEYRISLFLAATCRAALISLLAIPC